MNVENRGERLRQSVEERADFMIETGNIIYVNNTRYFAEANGVVKAWSGFGDCKTVGRIVDGKFLGQEEA